MFFDGRPSELRARRRPRLRKVIAIDPTQLHAWAHLGALFQKKKLKREALYAFREVTRLRGDDWRHWQNRALSAVSLAHFEEALFCARRSMEAGGPADAEVTSLVAQALHKRLPAAHGATGETRWDRPLEMGPTPHASGAAGDAPTRTARALTHTCRAAPPAATSAARSPASSTMTPSGRAARTNCARGAPP